MLLRYFFSQLLVLVRKKNLWVQARNLGLPWAGNIWSVLRKLQRSYNDGVRLHPLESIQEHADSEFYDDNAESISDSLFLKPPGTAAIAVSGPVVVAAPEDTCTRKVTGPYAARPELGRPPPYPAPSVPEGSTSIVVTDSSSHSPSELEKTTVAFSDF